MSGGCTDAWSIVSFHYVLAIILLCVHIDLSSVPFVLGVVQVLAMQTQIQPAPHFPGPPSPVEEVLVARGSGYGPGVHHRLGAQDRKPPRGCDQSVCGGGPLRLN